MKNTNILGVLQPKYEKLHFCNEIKFVLSCRSEVSILHDVLRIEFAKDLICWQAGALSQNHQHSSLHDCLPPGSAWNSLTKDRKLAVLFLPWRWSAGDDGCRKGCSLHCGFLLDIYLPWVMSCSHTFIVNRAAESETLVWSAQGVPKWLCCFPRLAEPCIPLCHHGCPSFPILPPWA